MILSKTATLKLLSDHTSKITTKVVFKRYLLAINLDISRAFLYFMEFLSTVKRCIQVVPSFRKLFVWRGIEFLVFNRWDELMLSNRTFYPKWHITWQALPYKTFSVLSWLFNMIYMISFVVQLNPCLYKHTSIALFHNFVTRNSRRLKFFNMLWSMEIYPLTAT